MFICRCAFNEEVTEYCRWGRIMILLSIYLKLVVVPELWKNLDAKKPTVKNLIGELVFSIKRLKLHVVLVISLLVEVMTTKKNWEVLGFEGITICRHTACGTFIWLFLKIIENLVMVALKLHPEIFNSVIVNIWIGLLNFLLLFKSNRLALCDVH